MTSPSAVCVTEAPLPTVPALNWATVVSTTANGAAVFVVNDHVLSTDKAFPTRSFTPLAPPRTRIEYVDSFASTPSGLSVTVLLLES